MVGFGWIKTGAFTTDVSPAIVVRPVESVARWIASWWRRPVLKIDCHSKPPWVAFTKWNLVGLKPIDALDKEVVVYYRIRVENTGHNQAKGCHVKLQRIWFVERTVWRSLDSWESVNLVWSGRRQEHTVNLSHKDEAFCDVGHIVSNYIQNNIIRQTDCRTLCIDSPSQPTPRFFLDLATEYTGQPNALQKGLYVLQLSVFSDNASTQTRYLELRFPGKYPLFVAGLTDGDEYAGVQIRIISKPPEQGTVAPVETDG